MATSSLPADEAGNVLDDADRYDPASDPDLDPAGYDWSWVPTGSRRSEFPFGPQSGLPGAET